MDSFERSGIFDDYFNIKNRFFNKHIVLLGLNDDTKRAIMLFSHMGINIDGFLADANSSALIGHHYMGVPIFGENDLAENQSIIVLDIFSNNNREVGIGSKYSYETLFKDFGNVVIYGAGASGQKCAAFLKKCGIHIIGFADRNMSLHGKEIDGIRVIPTEKLEEYGERTFIVVAIQDEEVADDAIRYLKYKNHANVTYFDPVYFEGRFCLELWERRENENFPVFWPACLRYIYWFLNNKEKKLYLYSQDMTYLSKVCLVMKRLGINIEAGLSNEISNCEIDGIRIMNVWNLLYEKEGTYLVWCLLGDIENMRDFIRQSGLKASDFVYGTTGPLMIEREYIMDTNLGYADQQGTRTLFGLSRSKKIYKVAVLGGSTSDCNLYYERSWTQQMVDIANQADIGIEVYVAATAGNMSSQEMMRLIRDILKKKPDIVISYSGVNECTQSVKNHPYSHNYMKIIFDSLMNSQKGVDFFDAGIRNSYSMGEEHEDDVWLANERIMNAICKEFGIPFLCFLQPNILTKKPYSSNDLELLEHCDSIWPGDMRSVIRDFYKSAKEKVQEYPWIFDLTGLFDAIHDEVYFDTNHLLQKMNCYLAKHIFDVIMTKMGVNE